MICSKDRSNVVFRCNNLDVVRFLKNNNAKLLKIEGADYIFECNEDLLKSIDEYERMLNLSMF